MVDYSEINRFTAAMEAIMEDYEDQIMKLKIKLELAENRADYLDGKVSTRDDRISELESMIDDLHAGRTK
jgi:chaperonin cofactor prefoldin